MYATYYLDPLWLTRNCVQYPRLSLVTEWKIYREGSTMQLKKVNEYFKPVIFASFRIFRTYFLDVPDLEHRNVFGIDKDF